MPPRFKAYPKDYRPVGSLLPGAVPGDSTVAGEGTSCPLPRISSRLSEGQSAPRPRWPIRFLVYRR